MATKTKSPYNVGMIRDFLDHLLWELRIAHYENTRDDPDITNPEFIEILEKYQKRHGAVLWTANEIIVKGTTEEEQHQWMPHIKEYFAALHMEAIEHLEALQPVFENALRCAAMGSKAFPVRTISLREFIDAETTDNEEPTP